MAARSSFIVGCHVRDAGVWKRTLPQARASGAWKDNQLFHAKASSEWKVAFADLIRALNQHSNINISSFDFSSPFAVGAGYRFNINGSTSFRNEPGTPSFTLSGTPWLNYETNFWTYDVSFTDITPTHNLDQVAAGGLGGVRIPLTGASQQFDTDRTTFGTESGQFTVKFFENLGPATAHMQFTLTISADANDL